MAGSRQERPYKAKQDCTAMRRSYLARGTGCVELWSRKRRRMRCLRMTGKLLLSCILTALLQPAAGFKPTAIKQDGVLSIGGRRDAAAATAPSRRMDHRRYCNSFWMFFLGLVFRLRAVGVQVGCFVCSVEDEDGLSCNCRVYPTLHCYLHRLSALASYRHRLASSCDRLSDWPAAFYIVASLSISWFLILSETITQPRRFHYSERTTRKVAGVHVSCFIEVSRAPGNLYETASECVFARKLIHERCTPSHISTTNGTIMRGLLFA